jgi:hypothetical protein
MARRTFFSFNFERDHWRAGQIRNSWVTKPDRGDAGFWDAASWEEVKKKGDDEIKKWIRKQLDGTSVTVVLIGAETNSRKYVDYEIEQSVENGNGLLGIYIHNLKDKDSKTDAKGTSPFDCWYRTVNGQKKYYSSIYSTYDWVNDNGYENMSDWIEAAAKKAGK